MNAKDVVRYALWGLSIWAAFSFSSALSGLVVSANRAAGVVEGVSVAIAKELAATREEIGARLDGLPDPMRKAMEKGTGGAIDAANPLKNIGKEAKRVRRRGKTAMRRAENDIRKGLKNSYTPTFGGCHV